MLEQPSVMSGLAGHSRFTWLGADDRVAWEHVVSGQSDVNISRASHDRNAVFPDGEGYAL